MRTIAAVAAALALCAGVHVRAASPNTEAQKLALSLAGSEPLRSGLFGVLAVTMNGDTLACVNPRTRMAPASNVKLITTGVALRELGPDYRYTTTLCYSGSVSDGVLHGDLYVVGGGDPTTGSKADCAERLSSLFGKWTKMLRDAGISRIDGRIVADPRHFSNIGTSTTWQLEDIGYNYGAIPAGLNFFENAQNFFITPGPAVGTRPFVSTRYPVTPWMQLENDAVTSAARTRNSVYYVNTDLGPSGRLCGSFPIDRTRGYTLECSNRFGAYTLAYYFCNHLASEGIAVSQSFADVTPRGYVRSDLGSSSLARAAAPSELKTLGCTYSAPLKDIVRTTNVESDNFFAETLLKTLGKKLSGSDHPDSCELARTTILNRIGLRAASCQLMDGSGLSRKNYVSADFFVAFLRNMARSNVYAPFFASLPVPGEQRSTLEYRMKDAPGEVRARIHMKSGSMDGVRCFSGYIESSDGTPGRLVAFSVLTGNVTAGSSAVYPILDKLILAIAAEN